MNGLVHNVVQVIVYRETPAIEYLLLQRTPADGGWWQPVTGHIEFGESELDAVRRELQEETGITKPKFVSQPIHTNDFEAQEGKGMAYVYMVEVARDQSIFLSSEHVEYRWLGLQEALELLKYDGNKENMKLADSLLAESR